MNIDNKRGRSRGFFSGITPYASAASGAALGFLTGGPMGAITGGKLGYEIGNEASKGFIKATPYAGAAGGATVGYALGGIEGAISGGSAGYEYGKEASSEIPMPRGFISDQKQREMSKDMSGETMYTLPYTNKRKRE
jgi:hypothetical protein